jgi:hypothetical protein
VEEREETRLRGAKGVVAVARCARAMVGQRVGMEYA